MVLGSKRQICQAPPQNLWVEQITGGREFGLLAEVLRVMFAQNGQNNLVGDAWVAQIDDAG